MKKVRIVIVGIFFLAVCGGIAWVFLRPAEKFVIEQPAFTVTEAETTETIAVIEDSSSESASAQAPETPEKKVEEVTKEARDVPKSFSIQSNLVSFGHESASGREINAVVLHSSHGVNGDPYNVSDVIALWKSYGVAPHYMIARDGTVYQLVADKNIAYHAGEGKMPDGRTGVNNFSIGVEILNTKTDSYTKAQYQATKDLIAFLEGKYGNLKVVGHDTIAPGRKTDPWNFDWSKI